MCVNILIIIFLISNSRTCCKLSVYNKHCYVRVGSVGGWVEVVCGEFVSVDSTALVQVINLCCWLSYSFLWFLQLCVFNISLCSIF